MMKSVFTNRVMATKFITHNYPTDEFGISDSFGEDDFKFISTHPELAKLRVASEKYNYELRALKPIDISYNEAYRMGFDISAPEDEIQHSIMKWLDKEGYVEYRRNLLKY